LKLSEKAHSLNGTLVLYLRYLLSCQFRSLLHLCRSANQSTEYSLGLNLFDAPDLGADLFVGRETELQEMEKALQPKSKSPNRRVLILGGMGGIGKTQLAVTYAKRHRSSYPSVFWLNATSESTLNSSLRGVANRVLPPETVSKLDDDQLRVQVSNWLSELDNTRWLLILDNYDDPDQYQIAEYYPSVAHGSVIITTQQPRRVNGKQVKVKSMTKAADSLAILAILATRSGRPNIQSGERKPLETM
jgi:NB-ARC domain